MNIDPLIVQALRSSEEVMQITGGRIYNTERSAAQMEEDEIPYCVVRLQSSTVSYGCKDDFFDWPDSATVRILCVAEDRGAVCDLVYAIMSAVADSSKYGGSISHITPTLEEAGADIDKPCHFQWINLSCDL